MKLDDFLRVGSAFDYAGPIAAEIEDIRRGGWVGFRLEYDSCGFAPSEVKHILAKHGIDSWGWMTPGNTVLFNVLPKQAVHAALVLKEANVPYHGGPGGKQSLILRLLGFA